MPIEIAWLIPDHILLSCWTGTITENDMGILIEELTIIFDTSERIIHSVIEPSEARTLSDSIFYKYYRSSAAQHPMRGRVALVNPTFQFRVIADILNRVAARELFHICDSREEARDFLLANDSPPPVFLTGYDQPAHAQSR